MGSKELIKIWLKIAQNNPCIRQRGSHLVNNDCAFEEPLGEGDFVECLSIESLYNELTKANWILGQPFYYKNLCFINQINGGDEFMVIRDNIDFESITAHVYSLEEFKGFVNSVLKASEEQLLKLDYSE